MRKALSYSKSLCRQLSNGILNVCVAPILSDRLGWHFHMDSTPFIKKLSSSATTRAGKDIASTWKILLL